MKKTRTTKCPYCGEKLNYAKAWDLKRRGEYICPKCGGLSNVQLASPIYTLGFFAIVLGLACFIFGLIFDSRFAPYTLGGIFLVFLIFFLLSPLYVRLRKPGPPKARPQRRAAVPRQYPSAQQEGKTE